ncbi:uncharacterized protein [Agelaius tricolor]|uniref:uncharacterized protein isoform X2 n=2 Tax=Agelaius tricolor TaxID=9191 RepID=UPI0039F1C1C0
MPTTVELGATWGKQEQERVHGVKCAFHQTFAPQVKQAVPRWAFVLPWHANSCRACQQTPTWPRLRNRRRRLVRVTERGGRRAEDFTALLPLREDSGARALGEGGEGGEGGREQWASQRLRYPSAELPELRRGGGEGEGQGRRPWRCPRRDVAPGDPGAAETRGLRRPGGCRSGWRRRAGGRGCPHGGRCAPLPRCPGGRGRSCRIPASLACLMNKPAIRLMLQVTLSSTKLLRPQQILILKKGTIDHQG